MFCAYDTEGNRVAKGTVTGWSCDTTMNGFTPTEWYILGQNGEQVTEADGTGNWQHTNAYADGQLIGTYDQAGLHFQLSDWEGTRRVEMDYAGNPQQTCTNAPFGDSAATCATPTEQFYTGQEEDTETGDDHFPASYYIPTVGLWATPDPSDGSYDINDPQTFNRYAYVNGNPLGFTDPTGLAGAGVLTGIGGNLCLGYKAGNINPCNPVISAISLGLGSTAFVPYLSFATTLGCGFMPSSDATSTFCGQSGWTALISKQHPDLAMGINDAVAAVGLADGIALGIDVSAAGAASVAATAAAAAAAGTTAAAGAGSISTASYLWSCATGGPSNPVCDVAIALVVYTVLNDIFSIIWDYFGHPAPFHGSMQPRPGVPGMQGDSSFGVPVQNLKIPGLPGSSSQNSGQSFGFRTSN